MKIKFFNVDIGNLPEYYPGYSGTGFFKNQVLETRKLHRDIELFDVVALTHDIPEQNLRRGEVGTVVEILANGDAFEVEFSDQNGQVYESLGFRASQIILLHNEPKQR